MRRLKDRSIHSVGHAAGLSFVSIIVLKRPAFGYAEGLECHARFLGGTGPYGRIASRLCLYRPDG